MSHLSVTHLKVIFIRKTRTGNIDENLSVFELQNLRTEKGSTDRLTIWGEISEISEVAVIGPVRGPET